MNRADNQGNGVYTPPPAPAPAPAPPAGTPAGAAVDWQAIANVMAQYQTLLKTSGTNGTNGTNDACGTGDGVTNANGAPSLPEGEELSGDDISLALMHLNSQMLESSLSPLQARLEDQRARQQQLTDAAVKKIMQSLEKAIEARAKSKAGSILGWISKIVSVITTVVATSFVAAQGPKGMLAASLIVTGLIAAMTSPDFEDADLSMSGLAARGAGTIYEACGMSPEQARKAATFTSGAVGLVSCAVLADPAFAGQVGQGSATVLGANQEEAQIVALTCTVVASVISAVLWSSVMGGGPEGAEKIKTAAQIARAVATLGQASVTISRAALDMELAELKRSMGKLGADADRIDAAIARVIALMQENQDLIKSIFEISQAKTEIISDILKSSQVQQSHMAHAI